MIITSLKDLEKLIKLCRKTGVHAITIDGISLSLGQEPVKRSIKPIANEYDPGSITIPQVSADTPIMPPDDIKMDMPTDDALLFWSADSNEGTAQ